MTKKAAAPRPTGLAYTSLDAAHEHFNRDLFGGTLPPCLVTLQRHTNSYGYFSGGRFVLVHDGNSKKEVFVDEIAMNPMHFAERSIEKTLSTLVHEMVHEWQKHFGREPTRCYHDKEWAAKMKEVGLYPSTTAAPGGKETGAKVSHYIVENGPFSTSVAAFLKTNKATLYQDRARAAALARKAGKSTGGDDGKEGEGGENEKPKSKGRVKFQCLGCKLNAWAKPSAKLRCEDCDRPLRVVEEEKEAA